MARSRRQSSQQQTKQERAAGQQGLQFCGGWANFATNSNKCWQPLALNTFGIPGVGGANSCGAALIFRPGRTFMAFIYEIFDSQSHVPRKIPNY